MLLLTVGNGEQAVYRAYCLRRMCHPLAFHHSYHKQFCTKTVNNVGVTRVTRIAHFKHMYACLSNSRWGYLDKIPTRFTYYMFLSRDLRTIMATWEQSRFKKCVSLFRQNYFIAYKLSGLKSCFVVICFWVYQVAQKQHWAVVKTTFVLFNSLLIPLSCIDYNRRWWHLPLRLNTV